jgi:DNA invertase Pin-like site-specific DNA recombinase
MTTAVAYYRVSTEFQRETGYSLAGQRGMVRHHVQESGMTLIGEYQEAESAYRAAMITLEKRPALRAALADCRRRKATLVIAALDRLARNVVFIATLVETRIPFVALDIPGATRFMIHIYAAMAEEESRQKGRLVSAALSLARKRGRVIWQDRLAIEARCRAEALRPIIDEIRASCIYGPLPTARELARRGVTDPSGEPWSRWRVDRLLRYLGYPERARIRSTEIQTKSRASLILPLVARARAQGCTMSSIAAELNARGSRTCRGLPWTENRLANFRAYQARCRNP